MIKKIRVNWLIDLPLGWDKFFSGGGALAPLAPALAYHIVMINSKVVIN